MSDNPLISILITVYNCENYIADCIESVLASTFKEWEMIVVDDCSTDNSVAIAREFEKQDPRIKVNVNEKNLGDYPNRNKAASYAIGKYLKYLDADDMIYPHGLEIFVKTMEQFPEAALGISQEVAEDARPYPFLMDPHETFCREFLKRGVLGVGPTGTIIRREVFKELGGYTGTRFIGDREMWLKLAAKYPVAKIVPGLIYWRRHEGQEYDLGQKSNFYLENNYFLNIKTLSDPDCPLSNEEKISATERIKKRFLHDTIRLMLKRGKFSEGRKLLIKSGLSFGEIRKYSFNLNWCKNEKIVSDSSPLKN